jgi:hypothetical protein
VVASEQSYAGPPEIRRIDACNPLKPSLLQLEAILEAPSRAQRDRHLAAPPSAAVLEQLGAFTETLQRFVQHCSVYPDGSGPFTADLMRPVVEVPPPARLLTVASLTVQPRRTPQPPAQQLT